MAVIGSVNAGHGTDACLCVMTQVYLFTIAASVEASPPLKVLNLIQFKQWTLFRSATNDIEFYSMWTLLSFTYCKLYMNPESWMTIDLMWTIEVNGLIWTLIR